MVILTIVAASVLFALSAFCKAAMDARVFQPKETAFGKYPNWFREWAARKSVIPIIKIDDLWHGMQMLMFLFIGLAYLLIGTLYSDLGLWIFASVILRSLVHGAVFELAYKSMK